MTTACRKPVLIVEGPGDSSSLPELIRRIAYDMNLFDFNACPHPITGQNIPKLLSAGQLERFICHATSREGDSVLICLDADKMCPVTEVKKMVDRIAGQHIEKKIAVCLMKSEYESMVLTCLDLVAQRYPEFGWNLDEWRHDSDFEAVVGAKGMIDRLMKKGRKYKETTDQARFTSVLDFVRLKEKSRSFRHLRSAISWLAHETTAELFYPQVK